MRLIALTLLGYLLLELALWLVLATGGAAILDRQWRYKQPSITERQNASIHRVRETR